MQYSTAILFVNHYCTYVLRTFSTIPKYCKNILLYKFTVYYYTSILAEQEYSQHEGDIWHLGNYIAKLMASGLINEAGYWTLIQLDILVSCAGTFRHLPQLSDK